MFRFPKKERLRNWRKLEIKNIKLERKVPRGCWSLKEVLDMIKLELWLISANIKHRNIRNIINLANRYGVEEIRKFEENKANFRNSPRKDRWLKWGLWSVWRNKWEKDKREEIYYCEWWRIGMKLGFRFLCSFVPC